MVTKKSESAQSSHIRIAVANVSSELSFESAHSPAEIKALVTTALSSGVPLALTDVRGHEILIPAEKIGYVEIGESTERRVGFGAL